jgi:hypothetical protein
LVALIAAAAAVTGAILIPADDARRENTVGNVDGDGPAFTVIGGDGRPAKSPAPTASAAPGAEGGSTGTPSRSGGSGDSGRRTRGSSIDVTNGEFAESSDEDEREAELEAEEEEAKQKAEEEADEQRCEEKKERNKDADC